MSTDPRLIVLSFPTGETLSVIRYPNKVWITPMELLTIFLNPAVTQFSRERQRSTKHVFRQQLAKRFIPYRLTTPAELLLLKENNRVISQAPSAMMMTVEDAIRYMDKSKRVDVAQRLREVYGKRKREPQRGTSVRKRKRPVEEWGDSDLEMDFIPELRELADLNLVRLVTAEKMRKLWERGWLPPSLPLYRIEE